MSRPARWPVFKTVGLSIVVAGVTLFIWTNPSIEFQRSALTAMTLAAGAGAVAAGLGRLIRLGTAWLVLVAIATPGLVLVPVFQPPGWIFLVIVLVLAGFYVNGVREQVPLYLSNTRTRLQIADLVPETDHALFIDLGCGLGGVVQSVANAKPRAKAVGVETAPLSFLISWVRILLTCRGNADIRFESIWETDVSEADVVYAFLSPAPMKRLNEKLRAEMKPGSIFISNSFAVPGLEPDTIVALDDGRGTNLLIWRM